MNTYPVYGNIICQDGMPGIVRTLDSLCGVVDKTYIVDGGSRDGTYEYLCDVKDIYNLEVFQRPFDTMLAQRNWLLEQTPQQAWIIAIDQDEALTTYASYHLRDYLHDLPNEAVTQATGKLPVVVFLWFINMIQDARHYAPNITCHLGTKCFFNDRDVEWQREYHCVPAVRGWDGQQTLRVVADPPFGIKHFVWMDPEYHRHRIERLKQTPEAGDHEYYQWVEAEHQVVELPHEWA